jgi:hypothetical protein
VTAWRAEVLFPSETSTRSGFGSCAEKAMPDIIPASRRACLCEFAFGFRIDDRFTACGAVREGCYATVFMDK